MKPAPEPSTPVWPTLSQATSVWAKIGLLGFGGPAGQIALMHRVLVEEKRWISESRFLHALNYCMLLPGPEAQQLATYVGWLLHGTRGGVIAGSLFVLPGFLVILVLSALYALFQDTALLTAVFFGLKAAVLAIVLQAVFRLGKRALKNRVMIAIAGLAFCALFLFQVPFPLVILVAGLAGYFGTRISPALFAAGAAHGKSAMMAGPFLIDNAMPQRRAGWRPALKTLLIWGSLWAAPFLVIIPLLGWHNPFMDIGAFFSRMAVVTFGGAYAVLAYVAQAAVDHWHWLKPGEMLDGLALAETTPGPLVLVLSYVGFMAGFRNPAGFDPLLAGVLAASLTAWVTFIPCFLWIFLGAPYVEKLRSNIALSGAMSALSAAVVGVILHLALWFALHVLFADMTTLSFGPVSVSWPVWTSLNLLSLSIMSFASLLVFRLKLGIPATLALCALAGLALA